MGEGDVVRTGAEWPLVGRGAELDRLIALISSGRHPGALLVGEAGVGKTRLATEALEAAERSGFATLVVAGSRAAATIPLGVFAPLLPSRHHGESPGVDDRTDLLRRSAAALLEAAAGRRLVLLVDNGHFLDDVSATLIHHLAVTNAAFVLVTVRLGEPAPEPVTALWKDDVVERVELEDLDTASLGAVLRTVLGGTLDEAAVRQLVHRARGNVLFLRELVLGAMQDGTLGEEGGIWRLRGPLLPSNRLVELIEARLLGLSGAERTALELVSLGEPLGSTEIADLTDAGLIARLERAGLVTSCVNGRRLETRLAHTLYGDVVRARIPAVQAVSLARSLCEVVEATGCRRREDVLRVATWRLDAGNGRPELMLAAAHAARWRYDFSLAERLSRAAVQTDGGFEAAFLAAQVASLRGQGRRAEDELAILSAQAPDDSARARVAVMRIDNLTFRLGAMDEALAVADEADAAAVGSAKHDEITARRTVIVLATQGPRAAADFAEQLLSRAEGQALVLGCLTGSYSFSRLGRLEDAIRTSERGAAAHRALTEPTPWYPCFHTFVRCEALDYAGRLPEARENANREYEQALEDQCTEAQAHSAWHLAKILVAEGRVRTAVAMAREAVVLMRQLGQQPLLEVAIGHLAHALALAGEGAQASAVLEEIDHRPIPPAWWTAVDILQARAWAAVARGEIREGRKFLAQGAALGASVGDVIGQLTALHDLARLGEAKNVTTEVDRIAAAVDGDLAPIRAGHVRALARRDMTGLLEAAEQFSALGYQLLAVEAASPATAIAQRAGTDSSHRRARRLLHALLARCDDLRTPALEEVAVSRQLSRGEHETARLAASGMSNKEIAEKLCLSIRTIENQLHRVYEKLGVSGRDALAYAVNAPDSEPADSPAMPTAPGASRRPPAP